MLRQTVCPRLGTDAREYAYVPCFKAAERVPRPPSPSPLLSRARRPVCFPVLLVILSQKDNGTARHSCFPSGDGEYTRRQRTPMECEIPYAGKLFWVASKPFAAPSRGSICQEKIIQAGGDTSARACAPCGGPPMLWRLASFCRNAKCWSGLREDGASSACRILSMTR